MSELDAVAITVAPAFFASWIAAMPTPPAPAWISTVCPAFNPPALNRQSCAVANATGTQAASAVASPSGMAQTIAAGTARWCACEPLAFSVTTRSPSLRPVTFAPIARTVPAAM